MGQQKLKGVITEVIDNGNMGTIKCASGETFTFKADQLEQGYLPILNDVVEFSTIEDEPFAVELFHRKEDAPKDSTGVDTKIKCPHCGKRIIPKASMGNGRVSSLICPKCQKELEKFDSPPKTSIWIWIAAILCGLIVATFIYQEFT